MTNATDELRRLLDERGEDYVSDQHSVTWAYYTDPHTATESMDGTLIVTGLTPEQAIAATLGGGKLTAEQVRETVEKHWHDLPADYDMPEATALPEYSYDWQAIADELNATLGGGECEFVIEDNMNESEGMGDVWFRCTNCDTTFDYYADDWLMKQNYCPHCGFKIRKAVKR